LSGIGEAGVYFFRKLNSFQYILIYKIKLYNERNSIFTENKLKLSTNFFTKAIVFHNNADMNSELIKKVYL